MKIRDTISGMGGRKFVLSLMGVVGVIVNSRFSLNIPESVMSKVADLVMLYIAGESAIDIAGTLAKKK